MEVKVGKVELSVTNNGTPKVNIYPEGSDFENIAESIEIIGEESIYAMTRKAGDVINIIEKGKWKNLEIPTDYMKLLNSPTYDRVKLLFRRSIAGVNKAVNGVRTQIDLDTAKMLIVDNLELQLKVANCVIDTLKNSETDFARQIIGDLKSGNPEAVHNALKIINDLTFKNISEISKDYKILNDCEEVKEPKVKKKS